MRTVRAALVESFDEPPHCRPVPAPVAGQGQEVAEVLAVGVHPATRGVAAGRHYTSGATVPAVAGVDAVVRRTDGSLAFVMAPGTGADAGTMAERIVIDPSTAVPVPAGADPDVVAVTMNPALSPWVALRGRVGFIPGGSVLVLGATGNAGSMAVRVARLLGARRVVAAGRNRDRLEALLATGADEVVAITPDGSGTAAALAAAAADVDVVLDHVWGPGTERAIDAISAARTDHVRVLDWVQVGAMGGPDVTVGGSVLRQNALRISGSGIGSVPLADVGLAELAALVAAGELAVVPRPVPLTEVERAWARQDARGERTVVRP